MRTRLRACGVLAVSIACVHCSGASGSALGKQTGSSSGSGGGGLAGTGGSSGASSGGASSGGTAESSGSSGGSGVSSGTAGSSAGANASDASSGDDGGAAAPGNCGMRTGMRGKTTRTLMVGSASRSYIAYLPQSASPTKALPFVYVFHGASQDGSYLYDMTQYSMLADSEGIAVVFPDGQGVSSATDTTSLTPWNVSDNGAAVCGAGSLVSNANAVDFAFMDAIKADVTQDQCLDAAHTFATGFS
ncbi:MAG TPA: hypothetical protein VK762_22880, partial [Polyangiaceae bacterium]|nr:hypothetical protein [Polyangiaceae bacterium]